MSLILAYACGLIVLYIIAKLLVVPVKIIWKLIVNALVGGITLLLVNFFGGFLGINIGINIVTALVAGILGFPGVVLLIIAQYLLA